MTPEEVQERLRDDLPPATLVRGRGAWPAVCLVSGPYWLMHPELNADVVRNLIGEVWMTPLSGQVRVAALCMDGASVQVQNMLLKILERPPASTRFILTADRDLLPTVESRCQVLVLSSGEPELGQADPRDVDAVGTAVRLAVAGRIPQLAVTLRDWPPGRFRLLNVWAAEAASQRWRTFAPALVPGVPPETALGLVAQLNRRPLTRLSALVALDQVFCRG